MAKDVYHNTVRTALEKDGWTITHDPLTLKIGGRSAYVDLGAEKLFAAEKGGQRIAVEVEKFYRAIPGKRIGASAGTIHHVFADFRTAGSASDFVSGDSPGCLC